MSRPALFACLSYRDASRAVDFLTALGFTELMLVRDEADPAVVHHAEYGWRNGGGVMFGTAREDDELGFGNRVGMGAFDLVVRTDDEVSALLRTALAHDAELVQDIRRPDFGGCNAVVRDFEGNLWCLDSYQGEPA